MIYVSYIYAWKLFNLKLQTKLNHIFDESRIEQLQAGRNVSGLCQRTAVHWKQLEKKKENCQQKFARVQVSSKKHYYTRDLNCIHF